MCGFGSAWNDEASFQGHSWEQRGGQPLPGSQRQKSLSDRNVIDLLSVICFLFTVNCEMQVPLLFALTVKTFTDILWETHIIQRETACQPRTCCHYPHVFAAVLGPEFPGGQGEERPSLSSPDRQAQQVGPLSGHPLLGCYAAFLPTLNPQSLSLSDPVSLPNPEVRGLSFLNYLFFFF